MAKVLNQNAAGIDIASNVHYAAVAGDKSETPVRTFKGFTKDLHDLAQWLVSLGIETVVMESTGSYWFQLYTILLDYGLEVCLVNAIINGERAPKRLASLCNSRIKCSEGTLLKSLEGNWRYEQLFA